MSEDDWKLIYELASWASSDKPVSHEEDKRYDDVITKFRAWLRVRKGIDPVL